MPKKLFIELELNQKGRDKKTGKEFLWDRFSVLCGAIRVTLNISGTPRDAIVQQLEKGVQLELHTKEEQFESEDGTINSYDKIFVLIDGEEVPVKAKDSYGKKLILKYLKTE